MNINNPRLALALLAVTTFFTLPVRAEYGYFDDVQSGSDIVMKEVRWPYWNNTYYNTWWSQGWTSTEGCSDYWYNGLALPAAGSPNPVGTKQTVNWSFWPISNPVNITDTITPAWTYPNTFSMATIGEGTIARAPGKWSGWRTNVWYRMVLRTWQPVSGAPHLGYAGTWMRDASSGVWYHMATVQLPFSVTGTTGSMSFQENATGGSQPQRTDYRGSYYHKNGVWHSSTNWHAYVSSNNSDENAGLITNSVDGTNAAVYYEVCQTNNTSYVGTLTHGMSSPEYHLTQPTSPTFDPIVVTNYSATAYGNQLLVQWQVPATSSPQFAYKIEIYTNAGYTGSVVASAYDIAPEAQQKLLVYTNGVTPYARLTIIDIFNQTNAPINITPVNASLNVATPLAGAVNGLNFAYYQSATSYTTDSSTNWYSMPNFTSLTPVSKGAVSGLDLTPRQRHNGYAFNYTGYINVPSDGLYAFTLNSCDGSKLYVDGQLVVNNDGKHSPEDLSGWIGLQSGCHTLNVQYFFDVQPTSLFSDYFDTLTLSYEGPGFSKTVVPVTAFYRVPGGSEPSVSLSSPADGTTISDVSVPLSATVTPNGNTINKVQFYVGDYYWAQDTTAPYSVNSFFWANANNPIRARMTYNSTSFIDSEVNLVTTTNMTLAPWQYNQAFYHNEPNGASIQNGTYSVIGDGVNLLTRQVTGDCTLIAHLSGITSSATAPDGSAADGSWLAGIILRGTTNMVPGYPWGKTTTAPFTAVFGKVGGGAYYQDETMVNGGGGYASGSLGGQKWFKIQRVGNTFTSSVSSDGSTWTAVTTNTLTDFGATIYAGLFSYAQPSANPNIHWATFDNVSILGNIVGPPTVSVTPSADTAYAGQSVTFTAQPGGNAPFYYQWQLNGVNLVGATNATLTFTNVQAANSGIYSVVLTNADGTASASGTLTVLTLPPVPGAILSNNPTGYWRLNETAGPTAYDSAGNNNGAGEGGILFGVPGVTNAPFTGFEPGNLGAQFDGNSSDVALPAFNTTTTHFTITGWVKRNGSQNDWSGLVFSRNGSRGVGVMVVGNTLHYSWNDNGDYNWGSNLALPDGQWAFFALTITPTNAIVYLASNATLQSKTNVVANSALTTSGGFWFGTDGTGSTRRFNGALDEIAIYNQTLTGAQIAQIFSASQTALPAVTLTAPATGANYGAPATINLSASVVTNGHAINRVQFYNGATLLGVSSNAPYNCTWTNVAPGLYTVFAQAVYDSNYTMSSTPAFITVNPLPSAPQNFSVVAVAANQISLAWTAAANATSYIVSRDGAAVATVTGTGWLDSGLAANTTYSYSVIAVSPWGSSAPSATNSATTLSSGDALVWDADGVTAGAQDGSGTWGGSATNWWNDAANVSWADNNLATFGAGSGGSYTVTIASDVTPAGIVFAAMNGAYTLAGGGGDIILTGTPAINCAVDGAVSAVLKGTGRLLKTGAGTLTLSGANTFSGGTTISTGTLQLLTGSVLPGNVVNYGSLLVNRSDSVNFGGVISGSGSVAKSGGGTLFFTNANTYSGGTVISGGILSLGTGASGSENVNAIGSGSVTVKTGGTLQLDSSSGSTTFSIGNAITLDGGTILSIDNYEHLTGPINVTGNGGTLSQYYDSKSLWIGGQLTGSGPLTINNPNTSSYQPYAGVHFSNPANTYSGTINVTGNAATVDNTYALSNATLNVTGAGSSGPLIWGSGVTSIVLGGLFGTYNIANGGNALSVGNNNSSTTYSGILSGAGSLTKLGTGTFTLSGANTYTGATTVNAGRLMVNGTVPGGVKVSNNGELGGIGVINGAVTNSGTLTAGNNGIGTLTVNNSLTLAGGSTTLMKLSRNSSVTTNDLLQISGGVTFGGTLMATNIGTNAFVLGDSFKLFNAGTYAGVFTKLALPALASGLSWNTNTLATNGTLTVAVNTAPSAITNLSMAVNKTAFTLTGQGTANAAYVLVAATNLSSPWVPLLTNTAGGNGVVDFIDLQVTNYPQRFYRVQSQ